MGRAERRKIEKKNRSEKPTHGQLRTYKERITSEQARFNTELLLTSFALCQHRVFGFGRKRILRSLQYMDEMVGSGLDLDVLRQELRDEVGIDITFGKE